MLCMNVSIFPKTIVSLVRPAIQALAGRLFVLTAQRKGSKNYRLSITNFFETGFVTCFYEQLLMSPVFAHLEIRHEMPHVTGSVGRPEQSDLWIRAFNGGEYHLIEVGHFSKQKVHTDAKKMRRNNPTGPNWFLALFTDQTEAKDPWKVIQSSFKRRNGLDSTLIETDKRLVVSFEVYRPNAQPDVFGAALFKVSK